MFSVYTSKLTNTDIYFTPSIFLTTTDLESHVCQNFSISFMKQKPVITHTIFQTQTATLLDSCVTNTRVKILYPHTHTKQHVFLYVPLSLVLQLGLCGEGVTC